MRFVIACCLIAGVARADGGLVIAVGVGQTAERDVGIAMGLRCDDLSVARVALREHAVDSNVLVVTGVAPGTTLCRVGLAVERPSYLFEIRVR